MISSRVEYGSSYRVYKPSALRTPSPPISCIRLANAGETAPSMAEAMIGMSKSKPPIVIFVEVRSGLMVT